MARNTPRARSLAAVLRDVQKRSGLSERDVARRIGVSNQTVNRWVNGVVTPNSEYVSAFLAVVGVVEEERERIMSLARAPESDWLVSGPAGLNPQLASVMEYERDATAITVWSPALIPGLLQTGDYARAVISRSFADLGEQETESMVMVRNYRREALLRRNPVTLTALVGLPALLGGVGGHDAMVDQLNHVLDMAKRDNITVQAVDLGGDWSPALVGQFVIYETRTVPPTVYLEHYRSGAFLVDEEDVLAFQAAAEQIRREAMSPDRTAGLIAEVITRALETTI